MAWSIEQAERRARPERGRGVEVPVVTADERITRPKHRVCELQTAVVVTIEPLAIEGHVAARARARLDESSFRGDVSEAGSGSRRVDMWALRRDRHHRRPGGEAGVGGAR
jgi:hypothetical protein